MSALEDVARRLNRHKERILAQWESQVHAVLPFTSAMNLTELRNSFPDLMDILVETLGNPADQSLLEQHQRVAQRHALSRDNYSLDQVIHEFQILQQVVLAVLEKEGPLPSSERDAVIDAFSNAIRIASTAFKTLHDQKKADIQDQLIQVNASLIDSLGHKSSEARLKNQLLTTIFERVEDYAIFSLDEKGNIATWSDGCQRIKKYSAEDVIGRHLEVLYPPDGRARGEPQAHLDTAAQQGRYRGEGMRMRKGGELFLADVFITPMYEGDTLLGYFKIVSDLSERNRVLQEIDLSRSQVRSLMAENELRDRFIYLLSHDLRNPLSAAQMNAEVISRLGCNVDKHEQLARKSIQHLRRVDAMICNLLDVSRIKENAPFPLKISQFDMVRVVEEVRDELATLEGDRFRAEIPKELVGFWDQGGVKRILENLAINAVKYGAPNGEVTISLQALDSRVLIKVHNFGPPIESEDQASLFEIFHRTESARRGSRNGWGLGLTLVRGLTEAQGGFVKVRSLPDEGTTFVIDLPRDARAQTHQPA